MNNDILKSIIRLKLEAIDSIIDCLPESVKEHAMNLKASFVKTASEVLSENITKTNNKKGSNKHKGLESINID